MEREEPLHDVCHQLRFTPRWLGSLCLSPLLKDRLPPILHRLSLRHPSAEPGPLWTCQPSRDLVPPTVRIFRNRSEFPAWAAVFVPGLVKDKGWCLLPSSFPTHSPP